MDSLSAPRTPGVSLQLCRRLCPRQAAPRSARRLAAGPAPPRAPRGAEGERAVLWRTSPRSPSPPSGPRRSWAGLTITISLGSLHVREVLSGSYGSGGAQHIQELAAVSFHWWVC
ncbi:Structural maintenance of chromosomes protein 4 [Manis javanica]|nr:Structural maintenance of chromosomes protein 4 [Manis javanica]